MNTLLDIIHQALLDLKASDITVIDVRELSNITEYMVIAIGTSSKHIQAIADNVVIQASKHSYKPLGIEGEHDADWILIDLNEVIVHVMLVAAKEYYQLDKLWSFKVNK